MGVGFKVVAEKHGEILRFSDAILARVEVNANMDNISEKNLLDAAAKLPLLPIDIEHSERTLVGMFTEAHVDNGVLFTGGIIYAKRFPELVDGFDDASNFLSIEGWAKKVECSACHTICSKRSDFCEHLAADITTRRKNGWQRKLIDFIPRGGAITQRPAGTDTRFFTNKMSIIASTRAFTEKEQVFIAGLNQAIKKYGLKIVEG